MRRNSIYWLYLTKKKLKDGRIKEAGNKYGKIGVTWQGSWIRRKEERLTMENITKAPPMGNSYYCFKFVLSRFGALHHDVAKLALEL